MVLRFYGVLSAAWWWLALCARCQERRGGPCAETCVRVSTDGAGKGANMADFTLLRLQTKHNGATQCLPTHRLFVHFCALHQATSGQVSALSPSSACLNPAGAPSCLMETSEISRHRFTGSSCADFASLGVACNKPTDRAVGPWLVPGTRPPSQQQTLGRHRRLLLGTCRWRLRCWWV